jgi:WD40 repeat protein
MMASIWDWERGEVVRTIEASANLVAFDSTGSRVATSRLVEAIVDVWDAQTGDRVATLTGRGRIGDLTYSPDGSTVATAHSDGTVRLWDPETGVERLVLRSDGRSVVHIVFGPDGSTLTSVSEDGIVREWALDIDDLIGIADERLTRELSDDECRQYLHLERCPVA